MRRKWLLLSAAAVLAGAAAFSLYRKARAPVQEAKTVATPASTNSEVTLSGKLRPQHLTAVYAGVEGDIDALLADVGDDVYEGELLANIGSSGLENRRDSAAAASNAAEAQVLRAETTVANLRVEAARTAGGQQQARAALDRARAVYDRQETLIKAGATARTTWENAQRDYQNAQREFNVMDQAARLSAEQVQLAANDLTAARKELEDQKEELEAATSGMAAAEVRSPVDGIVVARNGEAGKPPAQELYDIATDMYALEAELDAKPEVLRALHPGQAAIVLFPDLQNAGLPGEVKDIQNGQVLVQFNCTLAGVRPGMRVDVRLKLE